MIRIDLKNQIVSDLRSRNLRGRALRQAAMKSLSNLDEYRWSGVYRLQADELHLDEFVGAETEHTRIAVGQGVCGTAVAQKQNQIVDDVRSLENYLSCSVETRAEIVVLIWRNGQILGQIDIDGHRVGAFDQSDEQFLEEVAALLAERWDE